MIECNDRSPPGRLDAPVLETRHLRIVEAIDRAGTVSGAGRLIYMTQPAISRALLDLEERLGVPLFARTPKGMRATEAGRELVATATRVLDELRRVEHQMVAAPSRVVRLRLAVQDYTAFHWLPAVLAALARDAPRRDLDLVPQVEPSPMRALLRRSVDVAIVVTRDPPPGVVLTALLDDHAVAVLPPAHPLVERQYLHPLELAGARLLEHAGTEVLREAGVWPRGALGCEDDQPLLTEMALQLVAAGAGVTIMTRWATAAAVATGAVRVVSLAHPAATLGWSLAHRAEHHDEAVVARLASALRRATLHATGA